MYYLWLYYTGGNLKSGERIDTQYTLATIKTQAMQEYMRPYAWKQLYVAAVTICGMESGQKYSKVIFSNLKYYIYFQKF